MRLITLYKTHGSCGTLLLRGVQCALFSVTAEATRPELTATARSRAVAQRGFRPAGRAYGNPLLPPRKKVDPSRNSKARRFEPSPFISALHHTCTKLASIPPERGSLAGKVHHMASFSPLCFLLQLFIKTLDGSTPAPFLPAIVNSAPFTP